ncbi:MAG: hypothetical protein ACI9FJ_001902 [Alteromonadaceae bacterium]|jgi:hypothetical protein
MKFTLKYGLPFIKLTVIHAKSECLIQNVLIDTGSAASVFSSDLLATIGIIPEPNDELHRIQGVGGYEYVVQKTIDQICFDNLLPISPRFNWAI